MRTTPLLDCIAQYQMIPKNSTVFLGVSGGADSIYLLHRLYQLQEFLEFKLVALHFNHQLRGVESQRDEDFVRQFVAKYCPEIPLYVDTAPVFQLAIAHKMGVEEMARRCRYDFFQKYAGDVENSRIATAHNLGDNGETILMNLTRGAGLLGLSGIPPVRGNIIRPLLTTTRQEILDYLTLYSLPHMEDSSNESLDYTRNRMRHQVMPVLLEQNPKFLQNIAETSPILREEDEILNQLALDRLPPISQSQEKISLSASGLAALSRPLALRAIGILGQRLVPSLVLEFTHRTDVLSLCQGVHPSASVNLPCGITARREYDDLVLTTEKALPLAECTLQLPFDVALEGYRICATRGIYDGVGYDTDFWIRGDIDSLTLRPRREGDRLHRPNRSDKTVKSLMIDEKIPRHLRDSLPVLCYEDELVAVACLGVNQSALPEIGEAGWHITITTL